MSAKNPWFWLAAILAIALDRLTKVWVVAQLAPGESIALWPGVFHLTLVKNSGAAFSLFAGGSDWLKWISLLVSVGLCVYALVGPHLGSWEQMGFGLLLGGAVGNGFDRFAFGEVTDFLDFRLIQFPVFNGADIAINLGLACLLIGTLRSESRTPAPARPASKQIREPTDTTGG
ncbi:signal peptidase II [Gloeobacter violaceus]|uniref:Lipoprotein signal peptidase n=1 Tax=Gloeobacter violaceus (strain ATCC 29082 / PCC 7421) TaxID=251221 RepID=LSPA_GLOVI|nr:signal peptidase II [Gloeobacter violaceus]Q7NPI3.1 RecName: Full=Lipoprotein signal peptidase; AltName: Full=Prolipoprotein signal peptidase; AltName: Full=Signal peptidase II; Short=SPase II [Gloeobacter violaceus PCC 7421]BAC88013.1 lipoprotein signal peptidase [Gloeobacter violaceus PCC 7421]